MKKSPEQKECDKLQRDIKKARKMHEKANEYLLQQELESAQKQADQIIRTSTNREDLRMKLVDLVGDDSEFLEEVIYKRFPLTKLEKALK